MPDSAIPHQPHTFALWREAQDTRVRTRLGGIYYLLAWLLSWLFSTAPSDMLLSGLLGTALFTLLLALRWLHRLPQEESDSCLRAWIDRHWSLILVTSLAWGLAHAWTLYSTQFEPSRLIATLSTVAFSTAMAFSFSMRKGRCILAMLFLYLPGLAALGLHWETQQALLITLAFYLSYLLLALSRSHREYQATLALEQELLYQRERFDQLSRTDNLTQLGNRLQFNTLFPVLVASAQRVGSPLSLVLLDIDFFKRINDEFGHALGDACLAAFAERMRATFRRDSDALLRLGGEEFAVLMVDTTLEQARELGEQFRQELSSHGLEVQGRHQPLTTSLGVGCFDSANDASSAAFFKRVDDALYRAKANGRDCLVLADLD
ncbi:GGDEF domain-containing protein [Aquipseudomonas ullengensis]|uniref:diguanylate cyclase n=1 Tax=Aquipseudomonas ullengensis TaxID=2759166 RepID=A0A7W4LHS8_9GAMM|nr:GGDEF domain-containing protein [Pseudomonas ullengensis]MBB2493392.1 GGDEF domain-containing protein [Pseudomonas ullengensis]